MIESLGIATVVVGLVRPHMESTKPPRGLWVPFPLGRPFGEPESPDFQRDVLLAALSLLGRPAGPVLDDYSEDAPSMLDTSDWVPQISMPPFPAQFPSDPGDWVTGLQRELTAVRPHWMAARRRFGRTTVGNSRLEPEAWAPYAVQFLGSELPESPIAGLSPAVVLRYVADDMKALYSEAVQAVGPQPSSRQVNDWLWNHTLVGQFLRSVRLAALTSAHAGFHTAGSRFVVPAPWVTPA